MKTFGFVAAASLGLVMAGVLSAAADKPAGVLAQATLRANCQKCHGPVGDSDTPIYPRLNGQQAAYIAAQLKNFRDHKRDDTHARGYMWGMARTLDDKAITDLGQYFANQKPTLAQTGGALAGDGDRLYHFGDPARGIIACQQCHGRHGEGAGAIPRVAGQNAANFRMVLSGFRSGLHRND